MSSRAGTGLDHAVTDLYADLRLSPMLRKLLGHSRRLVDAVAGSISVIDTRAGRYSKLAEVGVACQLGRTFSLDEGATGQAVARRRPVVIEDYGEVHSGHLPPGHPANRGAVAAVPIWWRGDVIGVNVAFAGRPRRFTSEEIDALDVLTQTAAGAMITAGTQDPSLARLIREHSYRGQEASGARTVVTEVGAVRPLSAAVADAALDIVASAERAAARRGPQPRLHVALVYRPDGLRLLVQDETGPLGEVAAPPLLPGDGRWHELLAVAGGAADVERVPGWGTLLRADIPYAPPAQPVEPPPEPSPLTRRESEVLVLLGRGLADREIAEELVLSPKTVEKHVGAVLRKTRTGSRTAAVMQALRSGWLRDEDTPGGR